MPSQGPPLQNNQGTAKIIMSYILYYYIYIVSASRLFHYFHVSYPITFIIYIATFHRPNLLILFNNTNIKNMATGCIVYHLNGNYLLRLPPVTLEGLSPKIPRKNCLFTLFEYAGGAIVFIYCINSCYFKALSVLLRLRSLE
jgi:hypothetical protein